MRKIPLKLSQFRLLSYLTATPEEFAFLSAAEDFFGLRRTALAEARNVLLKDQLIEPVASGSSIASRRLDSVNYLRPTELGRTFVLETSRELDSLFTGVPAARDLARPGRTDEGPLSLAAVRIAAYLLRHGRVTVAKVRDQPGLETIDMKAFTGLINRGWVDADRAGKGQGHNYVSLTEKGVRDITEIGSELRRLARAVLNNDELQQAASATSTRVERRANRKQSAHAAQLVSRLELPSPLQLLVCCESASRNRSKWTVAEMATKFGRPLETMRVFVWDGEARGILRRDGQDRISVNPKSFDWLARAALLTLEDLNVVTRHAPVPVPATGSRKLNVLTNSARIRAIATIAAHNGQASRAEIKSNGVFVRGSLAEFAETMQDKGILDAQADRLLLTAAGWETVVADARHLVPTLRNGLSAIQRAGIDLRTAHQDILELSLFRPESGRITTRTL